MFNELIDKIELLSLFIKDKYRGVNLCLNFYSQERTVSFGILVCIEFTRLNYVTREIQFLM